MTYKNAKTIFFAALIAALIVPLSSMEFATADENSLKKSVQDMKKMYEEELEKVENETDERKKDSEHIAKLQRIIYRLDLTEQIVSLPNYNDVKKMTPEDLEKREQLGNLIIESADEEAELKKNNPVYQTAKVIRTGHSQGTWDVIYHTDVTGSVWCGAPINDSMPWNGHSDGLVEVYATGSQFYNDWDYDEEIYKNSLGGCANPPNDHISNTLRVVDISATADDCYVSTTYPGGVTSKFCDDFVSGTITYVYTRGTYDNGVYMETGSGNWGLGAILGLP